MTVNEAMAHVLTWRHAVDVQALRVLADDTGMPDGPMTRQVDCYLFTFSLRNLRRSVELVRKVAPRSAWSGIDKALNAFDGIAPDTLDLRGVLEHFDAYATGEGKLQDDASGPLVGYYSRGAHTYSYTVLVGPGRPSLTVEVTAAREAAAILAVAVSEAVP